MTVPARTWPRCLRLRDEGGPLPAAQVLACPNTDLTLSQPSVTEKAAGWGLSADDVAWGAELWVPDPALRADSKVSPLHATDLSGLPRAVIVTAEHDPLRDEGDLYATSRWIAAPHLSSSSRSPCTIRSSGSTSPRARTGPGHSD